MESGFKKLIVWQEALKLVILIYESTKLFPKAEDYALRDQMRRAVVSVLSHRISLKPSVKYLQDPREFIREQFEKHADKELYEKEAGGCL